MSWFSKHLGIRLDSHTLGNLVKNVSPVAGALVGGPAGLALAAGLSAGGDAARGHKISLSNALTNASLAGAGGALRSALANRGAASAGASALPGTSSASGVSGASGTAAGSAGSSLPLSAVPDLTATPGAGFSTVIPQQPGVLSSALRSTGSFIKDNPTATGQALQGIGNLATAGAQNRAANAQADLLRQQLDANGYDLQKRKERDAGLVPVWGQLGQAIGAGLNHVAPNPYATATYGG